MAAAEIDTNTGFISPSIHDGELRILDTVLAERLGFDRPRKIRELIRRHLPSIEEMGTCPTVGRVIKGNLTDEFYLNKKQAEARVQPHSGPNHKHGDIFQCL